MLIQTQKQAPDMQITFPKYLVLNFLNPPDDQPIYGHYYFHGCSAVNWSAGLFPESGDKKSQRGRRRATSSSMRHALWTFFHLKRPIRAADLPAHHMPIGSRAQTNTPRTPLSCRALRSQPSTVFS